MWWRIRRAGYGVVTVSLKPIGGIPGDASAEEMDTIADLAKNFQQTRSASAHEQNLVLPHVALDDLPELFDRLSSHGLPPPIRACHRHYSCPGLDYCALATARSIPSRSVFRNGSAIARGADIGELKINISRLHQCLRTSPRRSYRHSRIGEIWCRGLSTHARRLRRRDLQCRRAHRRGFSSEEIVDAIETVVDTYLKFRTSPARISCRLPADWHGTVQGGSLWP